MSGIINYFVPQRVQHEVNRCLTAVHEGGRIVIGGLMGAALLNIENIAAAHRNCGDYSNKLCMAEVDLLPKDKIIIATAIMAAIVVYQVLPSYSPPASVQDGEETDFEDDCVAEVQTLDITTDTDDELDIDLESDVESSDDDSVN